jgi:predicted nucleic acid-binding protein
MRVVIDTNLLLASISPKSSSNWLYKAIFSGQFTLCVTTDMIYLTNTTNLSSGDFAGEM